MVSAKDPLRQSFPDRGSFSLEGSAASGSAPGGKEGEIKRKIICFGFGEICQLLRPGDFIDVACEISINQWNGNKEIQLSLIDIKKHTS